MSYTPEQLQQIALELSKAGIRIGSKGQVYQTAEARPNFYTQISKTSGIPFGVVKVSDNSRSMRVFKSDRSPTGMAVSFNGRPGKRGNSPFINVSHQELTTTPTGIRVVLDFPLAPNLLNEFNNFLVGSPSQSVTTTPTISQQIQPAISQATSAPALTPAQQAIYNALKGRVSEAEAIATAIKMG